MTRMTGAEVLADVLQEVGVEYVAGIPGHTVNDFALAVGASKGLRPILVRHEATATFAADVYFRISGKPMVAFTHAFPGAANGLVGLANAYADYSAVIHVGGDTASAALGRGGYQELSRQFNGDTAQLLRPVTKRVWQPRSASDIAQNAVAAYITAVSGRPGPVSLNVPQEIWSEDAGSDGAPDIAGFAVRGKSRPDQSAVERTATLIGRAARPLIVAGNGVNVGRARAELMTLARENGIPVATTAVGKGAFPEDDPLSVGVVGWTGSGLANAAARAADLILVLGARLAETTASSWAHGATFNPGATTFVQADIDQSAIANAYPVAEALIGDMTNVLADLELSLASSTRPDLADWRGQLSAERASWAQTALASRAPGTTRSIGTGAVVCALRRSSAEPLNLVNDCGKHHKWIVQQFEARKDDYVVSSMGGASMGIGLAGAIGAALARPQVRTVAWLGDGGLSMSLAALPTVAEYRLPITIVVIDDAAYGVVANMQMNQKGRTAFSVFDGSGTNPDYRLDFAAVARACGIAARVVADPGELTSAFGWAMQQDGPSLLNIISNRQSVHPAGGGVLQPLAQNARELMWLPSGDGGA